MNKTTTRRDRKKQEVQTRIVNTAMMLFERHGLGLTTMESIADACDIAKATLYRYYPAKEAILAAYWQQKGRNDQEALPDFIAKYKDIRSCLIDFVKAGMQNVMKSHELYSAYFSYRMQNINNPVMNAKLSSGLQDVIAKILAHGVERGELRSDLPVMVLAFHLELSMSMLSVLWLRKPKAFKLNESVAVAVELFLNGSRHANSV